MCSLIGRGEDDLRLGCKAQLLAFLVLFLYIFLNYMCHLISFVGLVLAIVRGVAPVSTIELARKEKKVLVCMCRFRSSSVVLSLDLIPELWHSWNTFLSLSSGWHPESPSGWTGSWRGKPRSGNILYIYLYQKHLTCLLLYYLSLFNGKWSSLIRSFFSSSATFSQSKISEYAIVVGIKPKTLCATFLALSRIP